jgi:Ca-activated chloride channel family protein
VIDSCRAIVGSLKRNDVISIVTWNTQTAIPLDSRRVNGPNDSVALAACNGLVSDGGTDLDAGLRKGYELAYRNYIPGAINRLVLMSDGGANVGETNPALIAQKAGGADEEGVFLAGVGMGASYDDTLMNTVTDAGRGAYLFLDGPAAIERVLADDRFVANFDLAVKDVRLKLVLPPGFAVIGFARRPWTDESFRTELADGVRQFGRSDTSASFDALADAFTFHQADFGDPKGYAKAKKKEAKAKAKEESKKK